MKFYILDLFGENFKFNDWIDKIQCSQKLFNEISMPRFTLGVRRFTSRIWDGGVPNLGLQSEHCVMLLW